MPQFPPCIAVKEPFCSFLGSGLKPDETRPTAHSYTGPVLLSTCKTVMPFDLQPGDPAPALPLGCICYVAYMAGSSPCTEALRASRSAQALRYGFYSDGRHAWHISNVRKLRKPIPVRNMPGVFPVWPQLQAMLNDPSTDPVIREELQELLNLQQLSNLEQEA